MQLVQQALRAQLGLRRPVLQDADAAAQARDTARGGELPAVLRIELRRIQPPLHQPCRKHRPAAPARHPGRPTPAGETLLGQRVFIVRKPAPTPDAAGGTRALAAARGRWRWRLMNGWRRA